MAEDNRPYLCVLDGRVLPLDELHLTMTRDCEPPVRTITGDSVGGRVVEQHLDVRMVTGRNPMLRHGKVIDRIFIYDREHQMTILHPQHFDFGMSMEFGNSYEIEFTALDWELGDR